MVSPFISLILNLKHARDKRAFSIVKVDDGADARERSRSWCFCFGLRITFASLPRKALLRLKSVLFFVIRTVLHKSGVLLEAKSCVSLRLMVYLTLCCTLLAAAVGSFLHSLLNIGSLLTTFASDGCKIWLFGTRYINIKRDLVF